MTIYGQATHDDGVCLAQQDGIVAPNNQGFLQRTSRMEGDNDTRDMPIEQICLNSRDFVTKAAPYHVGTGNAVSSSPMV